MGSDNGAKASVILYSLVETAKANEVNTYQYLELLLTEIPMHMDDDNLKFPDELLPPGLPRCRRDVPAGIKRNKLFKVQLNHLKPCSNAGFYDW